MMCLCVCSIYSSFHLLYLYLCSSQIVVARHSCIKQQLKLFNCSIVSHLIPVIQNSQSSAQTRIICIIIITFDIYIAPYSARSCSKALYNIIYNIIIPDSDLFPPSTHLNSQGSIQCMLPLQAQSITQTHSHQVLSGTHFLWMTEPVTT